jgi:hypothetical protein
VKNSNCSTPHPNLSSVEEERGLQPGTPLPPPWFALDFIEFHLGDSGDIQSADDRAYSFLSLRKRTKVRVYQFGFGPT